MIKQSQFYFLRHGETDFNARKILHDETDIPLNEFGRIQANQIKHVISGLPVQTICVSPLRRAIETAEIAAADLLCSLMIVEELRECSGTEWLKMVADKPCKHVQAFMNRVLAGINKALSFPGPVLIVSHGGVHWALCHQIDVTGHEKMIGNCVPVHFAYTQQSAWKVARLGN